MELAITAFLRPFMPKHGAGIPQPLLLMMQQTVFDGGTHTPGGAFGSQSQAIAVTILKGAYSKAGKVEIRRPKRRFGLLRNTGRGGSAFLVAIAYLSKLTCTMSF